MKGCVLFEGAIATIKRSYSLRAFFLIRFKNTSWDAVQNLTWLHVVKESEYYQPKKQ